MLEFECEIINLCSRRQSCLLLFLFIWLCEAQIRPPIGYFFSFRHFLEESNFSKEVQTVKFIGFSWSIFEDASPSEAITKAFPTINVFVTNDRIITTIFEFVFDRIIYTNTYVTQFVIKKALYPSFLHVTMQFRLYLHLLVLPRVRGRFIASSLR